MFITEKIAAMINKKIGKTGLLPKTPTLIIR